MRKKRARGRSPHISCPRSTWSVETVQWAHCEWFMSWLDAPFFAHSEFVEVLYTMGLDVFATGHATRAQWGRLRAAMCNAFDGGHASPRRLSSAFLAMERRDLALYRADARAVLRGRPLPDAQDPASGTPLKPHWWARYKFPPPALPPTTVRVLVRLHDGGEVRTARFLSLAHTEGFVRVRLEGSAPVDIDIPDIDVMLEEVVDPPTPASVAAPTPAGLRTPPAARRVAFGQAPGPSTPISARRLLSGTSSAPRLVAPSPRAALVTQDAGGFTGSSSSVLGEGAVEAEVDVGQLASLIRVYEQREAALERLKRVNDTADAEMRGGNDVSTATRRAAESALSMVIDLSSRTQHLFPASGLLESANASPAPVMRIAQRLDDAFGAVATSLQLPSQDTVGRVLRPPMPSVLHPPNVDAVHPPISTLLRPPDVMRAPIPALPRSDVIADFCSADGALLLGKSLSRSAMARLQNTPGFTKLRTASAAVKADVMECVAACVALLVRARTTKDSAAVNEMVQLLHHRFPNMPDSVRIAAAELGASSSESQ